MKFHALVVASMALGMAACGFAYDEPLVGRYRALAVDRDEQMSICEGLQSRAVLCVVPATVFAIGIHDDFIVAKRHPMNEPEETSPDRSVAEYWIIRIADRSVVGPLTEDRFQVERVRLAVPTNLDFTIVFEDLR